MYLCYTMECCADVDGIEPLMMLCKDSQDLIWGRCIYQPVVDLFWFWILCIVCIRTLQSRVTLVFWLGVP